MFCISKEIPQGLLGVHMCAQSTKDLMKWNLVFKSPNWFESIEKKRKKKKEKRKKKKKVGSKEGKEDINESKKEEA